MSDIKMPPPADFKPNPAKRPDTAYAWVDDKGKFRLSIRAKHETWGRHGGPRPANVYDDKVALLREARERGLKVVWEE